MRQLLISVSDVTILVGDKERRPFACRLVVWLRQVVGAESALARSQVGGNSCRCCAAAINRKDCYLDRRGFWLFLPVPVAKIAI